ILRAKPSCRRLFKQTTIRACSFARTRAGNNRAADRKSTRLNSSHGSISYAVFCLKKKGERDRLQTAEEDERQAIRLNMDAIRTAPIPRWSMGRKTERCQPGSRALLRPTSNEGCRW